jgi:hypothetical protein
MTNVRNFSRHGFNADQEKALRKVFPGCTLGAPESPFFTDATDVGAKVSGATASLVVPWDLLLDALAEGNLAAGTTLVAWRADESARKRGRFAATAVTVFTLTAAGTWEKVTRREITPTVETDFRTGETTAYEG